LIDLYSDTQTRPTAAMRLAMAQAEVGDEQADEDPTTRDLCERVAGLLGMAQGVFMPSGTMCNLAAIASHTRPGDELVCAGQSHIVSTEAAGAAAVAGVAINPVASVHGIFDADALRAAIRPRSRTAPRSALLCVEQTTFSGGAIWPLTTLRELRDIAQQAGLRCHIDGARLLNASAATGIAPHDYAAGWDSAWIDLSKGLGCPVGAVLCGDADFIASAWQWKTRLGGAMRQSGILAAAGLYALDHHVEQLKVDHANAQAIWHILAPSGMLRFDPPQPASNILRFHFVDQRIDAFDYAATCLAAGVRVRAIDRRHVRVTTHLDVGADEARLAAGILLATANRLAAR
jgi:threonine aldolase